MRRAFVLDLAADDNATAHLAVGGVFIPNASVDFDDECHIVLRAGDEDVTVAARAVQITEAGVGFQIELTDELRERIAALVALARHGDLGTRTATLTRSLATNRAAVGSIPPLNRRGADRRMAEGSISPLVAAMPTLRDEELAAKVRSALSAHNTDPDVDTDD